MAEVELNLVPWLDRASRKKYHEDERARIEVTRFTSWADKLGHAEPCGRELTPTGRTWVVIWPRPKRGAMPTSRREAGRPGITGVAQPQVLSSWALRVTRAQSEELGWALSHREAEKAPADQEAEGTATRGCLAPKSPESPIGARATTTTEANEPHWAGTQRPGQGRAPSPP